jgi:cobalt-zinc-cadmium efflux system protein
MKTERNILVAFLLNLFFSIFELIGGFLTGSVAIVSDAVHDLGDALSIGLAYLLEKKSKKQPDTNYTYGYARYSVLGALITSTILIVGSVFVIFNAVNRIINPVEIRYNGMIIFAIIGASVNFLAAYFTREGDSMNQKAVNLHMLEDVLGWVIVLIGAITMKFTDFRFIDPVLSIGVALFILVNALKSYKSILDLFLEKTPDGVDVEKIRNILMNVSGVNDVHHIHIWSLDGVNNYATLRVVTNSDDIAVVIVIFNLIEADAFLTPVKISNNKLTEKFQLFSVSTFFQLFSLNLELS